MATGFEAELLRSVFRNVDLATEIGDRAVRALEDAAVAIGRQLLTARGPATIASLQLRLANIRAILGEAGARTYDEFVEGLVSRLERMEGGSRALVAAAVDDALEAGTTIAQAGPAAAPMAAVGVSAGGSVAGAVLPSVALRTAAALGPLELAVLASERTYSLSSEFAKAFMTPMGTSIRDEIDQQTQRLIRLFEGRVRSAVINGQTNQEVVRQLLGEGREITGDAAPAIRQVRALARTGVQSVANAVNRSTFMANDAVQKVEFLATLDGRTSPLCRGLSGRIFPKDKAPSPPMHMNCVAGDTLVSPCGRIAVVFRRRYEGPVHVLRTADGRAAKLTPNHPVLTDRGWQPAKLLKVGDRVFQARSQREAVGNPQDEQMVRAEDLAASFREAPGVFSVAMPVTPEDFHGDGQTFSDERRNREVCVVDVDRRLTAEVNPQLLQAIGHVVFQGTADPAAGCGDSQPFRQGLASAPGGTVGGCGETPSFARGHAGHPGQLLVSASAQGDASRGEGSLYGTWADAESLGHSRHANTRHVERDDRGFSAGRQRGSAAEADPGLREAMLHAGSLHVSPGDPQPSGDRHLGQALRPEQFDLVELVCAEVEWLDGHVYNLETELATYVAGSILTHNCRSTIVPYIAGAEQGRRSMTMGVVDDSGKVRFVGAYGDPERFTAAQRSLLKRNQQGYAIDYGEWLKAQPTAVQVSILGAKRQAIFARTGSLLEAASPAAQRQIVAAGYNRSRRIPRRRRPAGRS